MAVSRRRFLGGAAAAGAAAAVAPQLDYEHAAQAAGLNAVASDLPLEVIALNRMGYGPRPGDIAAFRQLGATPDERLATYVDQQLSPDDGADTLCQQKLSTVKLRISYTNSDSTQFTEDRGLVNITKPLAELWQVRTQTQNAERNRPADETRAATWLRAVYSKWQLREVMVEFWHNHFNVNAYADTRISATWPLYDALMRSNWNGNFRLLLEKVAQSVAMQYYLNNVTNKAGGPNENYARELFELHTLGSGNYFNSLYNRWSDVPGAKNSPPAPIGYIDQDIYEAARAFTGWTIADNAYDGNGGRLPNTGEFMTFSDWHDRFQKRVLATEFDPDQSALADGRKVLDRVAYHTGTARYICTKLCRRLVTDVPPPSLVDRAVETWLANTTDPNQIGKTLRAILLSDEFKGTWGGKVKRPFEALVSFIRITDLDFPPKGLFNTGLLSWATEATGYRLFTWPTPTGHPDEMSYWLGTNVMLRRWNMLNDMLGRGFWGLVAADPLPFSLRAQIPASAASVRQIVDFWIDRLLGRPVSDAMRETLVKFLAQNGNPDAAPVGTDTDLTDRMNYLVTLICMSPEFHMR